MRLYIGLVDLIFLISTFNIRSIGSMVSYFFRLFSMNLFRYPNPGRRLNRLVRIDSGKFLPLFLIDFFYYIFQHCVG